MTGFSWDRKGIAWEWVDCGAVDGPIVLQQPEQPQPEQPEQQQPEQPQTEQQQPEQPQPYVSQLEMELQQSEANREGIWIQSLTPAADGTCSLEYATDFNGGDYMQHILPTAELCCSACASDGYCKAWTFVAAGPICYLKTDGWIRTQGIEWCVSGIKGGDSPPPPLPSMPPPPPKSKTLPKLEALAPQGDMSASNALQPAAAPGPETTRRKGKAMHEKNENSRRMRRKQ